MGSSGELLNLFTDSCIWCSEHSVEHRVSVEESNIFGSRHSDPSGAGQCRRTRALGARVLAQTELEKMCGSVMSDAGWLSVTILEFLQPNSNGLQPGFLILVIFLGLRG